MKDLPADRGTVSFEQRLALSQARTKGFRWKPGQSGNPAGNSRLYFECRKIAQAAAPDMMRGLVALAKDENADERTRAVCLIAVLDRAGIKPIEAAEMLAQIKAEQKAATPGLNPAAYSSEELDQIEAVLRLVQARQSVTTIEAPANDEDQE